VLIWGDETLEMGILPDTYSRLKTAKSCHPLLKLSSHNAPIFNHFRPGKEYWDFCLSKFSNMQSFKPKNDGKRGEKVTSLIVNPLQWPWDFGLLRHAGSRELERVRAQRKVQKTGLFFAVDSWFCTAVCIGGAHDLSVQHLT
jgi:hypothetical protein